MNVYNLAFIIVMLKGAHNYWQDIWTEVTKIWLKNQGQNTNFRGIHGNWKSWKLMWISMNEVHQNHNCLTSFEMHAKIWALLHRIQYIFKWRHQDPSWWHQVDCCIIKKVVLEWVDIMMSPIWFYRQWILWNRN